VLRRIFGMKKAQEPGDNFLMSRFIISTILTDINRGDEMGETCMAHVDENLIKYVS
jgi:hypothetical protein